MKGIKFSEKYFKKHYFSIFDKFLINDFKNLYKSDLNSFIKSKKEYITDNMNLLKTNNLGAFNIESNKVKFYKEIVKSPLLTKLSNLNEMKNYQSIYDIVETISFNGISEFDGVLLITNIFKARSLFWIKANLNLSLELTYDTLIKSTLSDQKYIQIVCLVNLCHFYKDVGNAKFCNELALYAYKAYFQYNLNCEFLLNEIVDLCIFEEKSSLKFITEYINKYIEPLKKELPINYFLNKNNFCLNFNMEDYLNIYEAFKKKCLSKTTLQQNKSNINLINETFLIKHIGELESISTTLFIKGRLIESIKTIDDNINSLNQSLNLRILINFFNESFNQDIINNRFCLTGNGVSKNDILPKFKQYNKLINDYSTRNLNSFKKQAVKNIKDHDFLFAGYYENKLKMLNIYFLINLIKEVIKKEEIDLYYNEYVESKFSTNSLINFNHLISKLQIFINTKDTTKALTVINKIKSQHVDLSRFPKLEYNFCKLEISANILMISSLTNNQLSDSLKLKENKKNSASANKSGSEMYLERIIDSYNRFLELDSQIFEGSLSPEKFNLNLMLKKNKLNTIIKNI